MLSKLMSEQTSPYQVEGPEGRKLERRNGTQVKVSLLTISPDRSSCTEINDISLPKMRLCGRNIVTAWPTLKILMVTADKSAQPSLPL